MGYQGKDDWGKLWRKIAKRRPDSLTDLAKDYRPKDRPRDNEGERQHDDKGRFVKGRMR